MIRQELETIIAHANELIRIYICGETKQENDLYKRGFFNIDDFKNIVNLEEEESFSQRVKLSPTYRPFANAEECWNEMLKHQPVGYLSRKKNGDIVLLANICVKDNSITLVPGNTWLYENAIQFFTFADGSVFGVKEESEG